MIDKTAEIHGLHHLREMHQDCQFTFLNACKVLIERGCSIINISKVYKHFNKKRYINKPVFLISGENFAVYMTEQGEAIL